jgi:hypothetical protein
MMPFGNASNSENMSVIINGLVRLVPPHHLKKATEFNQESNWTINPGVKPSGSKDTMR